MTTLTAVVATLGASRLLELRECLISLTSQSTPLLEILLVFEGDETAFESIRKLCRGFGIQCIETAVPGLSGARNTGLSIARGDVVAFVDDDARVGPEWSSLILGGYEDEGVIGVGGWVEPDWIGGRPTWFPSELDWVVGCHFTPLSRERGPVRNIIGANMSFRKDVLVRLGGFRMPGSEEMEFCLRAQETIPHARILLIPEAVAKHRVPGSRQRLSYLIRRSYFEGISKWRVVTAQANRTVALSLTRETGYLRHLIRVLPNQTPPQQLAVCLSVLATLFGYLRAKSLSKSYRVKPN